MNWIDKQRNIVDFALSSLLRRWKKNLALLCVYTFVVFIVASVVFFAEALKREACLVLEGAPDVVVQRLVAGRHDLISRGHMEKLARITGVSDVKGRLWAYYFEPSVGPTIPWSSPRKPPDVRERWPSVQASPGRCRPERGTSLPSGATTAPM